MLLAWLFHITSWGDKGREEVIVTKDGNYHITHSVTFVCDHRGMATEGQTPYLLLSRCDTIGSL